MSELKTCPQCGAEHKLRIARCGCGYQWVKPGASEPARDPMRGCCAYTAGALRCHYPAAYGASLNGSGLRYCSAHAAGVSADMGARIVERSHVDYPNPDWSVEATRARVVEQTRQKMLENNTRRASRHESSAPGKGWAYRIMERIEQGDPVPMIAEQMARRVVDSSVTNQTDKRADT